MDADTCCNHNCREGRACPERRERATTETVRRFPRTAGEAFKDVGYSNPFEPHIAPPLLKRIELFLKRWCP